MMTMVEKVIKKKTREKKPMYKSFEFWAIIYTCLAIIVFLVVLDPTNNIPPRVSKECCDNWCAKGDMVCHRYTSDYIMCRFSEDKVKDDGITPTIDFWVYNQTKVCYGDEE